MNQFLRISRMLRSLSSASFTSMALVVCCALLLSACGPDQKSQDGATSEISLCDGGNCTTPDTSTTDTSTPDASDPTDTIPEKSNCQPGTEGCRCTETNACDAGLRCDVSPTNPTDTTCRKCPEGTAGCACQDGKTCSSGLTCQDGTCQGCTGKANCSCHGNGACDLGHICIFADNGDRSCKACEPGQVGCSCKQDSDCGVSNICVNFRCMDPKSTNAIPKKPKCYSTCQADIKTADGTIKACHPEYKLVEGCPTGQECTEGSCLNKSQRDNNDQKAYPYCTQDSNCPTWQTCVGYRCYSTCLSTSDCEDGFKCYQYVCRRECSTTNKDKGCDNQSTCSTQGSDDGVCLPKANHPPATTPISNEPKGTFSLPSKLLSLSDRKSSEEFQIINKGEFPADFVISRISDTIGSKQPLSWLKIETCETYTDDGKGCKAFSGKPSAVEPFEVKALPVGKMVILRLVNATGKPASQSLYQGALEIKSAQLGAQQLTVDYREKYDGHWRGTMVAFGNFDDTNVDKFPASTSLDIRSLKNALLRRWVNYKRNEIDRDKFFAAIRAIREGTWKQQKVLDDCRKLFSTQASNDVACYPFFSSKGYEILANSLREAPVPSGVSELPLGINIKEKSGALLEGRIDTGHSLQYPGFPQIQITLPAAAGSQSLRPLQTLAATIDIGGRFYVGKDETCPDTSNFQKVTIPWMLPGFEMGTYDRPGSLFRDRFECRAKTTPRDIPAGATKEVKEQVEQYNTSLSASNPVPNGWKLRRKIELVDGAIIDGDYIFAIYKERFVSFFSDNNDGSGTLDQDFVNYGYLFLRRVPSVLEDKDYVGTVAASPKVCTSDSQCSSGQLCRAKECRNPSRLQQLSCDPAIVKAATGLTITKDSDLVSQSSQQLRDLALALIGLQSNAVSKDTSLQIEQSSQVGAAYSYTRDGKTFYIHYYCEDTRQFDGGLPDSPTDCPADSKVIFFEHTSTEETLRKHACQSASQAQASCEGVLQQLRTGSDYREGVPYKCKDPNAVFCEANRKDMREGKIFFKPSSPTAFVSSLSPLRNALFEAFRYRIKFQSRTGKQVGFTPELCSKVAPSQTPYCYDPTVIEELERRVNCLEVLLTNNNINQLLSSTIKAQVKSFLEHAFSYSNRVVNGVIFTDPGFETLNAELKVMLGDEAFTRSFASRYDLANTGLVSFQGSLLEPNGIDVSGALGYEMVNLYISTQYYQLVLDRFYSQSSVIYQSFRSASTNFIGADAVSSYFQKLLLASTRKARSWSQIARRYHELNRADLAKHVVERAYAGTLMEMTILTRLLRELMQVVDASKIDQIASEIDKVTLTYKSALLDMQETYKKLSLGMNHFGLPNGYVPFPALDTASATNNRTNAFGEVLQFAKEKLAIAQSKEEDAIQTKRSFDTSAASFQSELVKVEQNYEDQLSQLCGNIEVTDANGQTRLVPAIPRYSTLSDKTSSLGDPCGLLSGGALYEALVQVEKARISILALQQRHQQILVQIEDEKKRIQLHCNNQFALTDISWTYEGKNQNLQLEVEETQRHIQRTVRIAQGLSQAAGAAKCQTIVSTGIFGFSGSDCPTAWQGAAIALAMSGVTEGIMAGMEGLITDKRKSILDIQRQLSKTQLQFECKACSATDTTCDKEGTAQTESNIRLKEYSMSILELNYEALRAQYDMQSALSNVKRLKQQASRLITQLDENTQLAINVQAAQNDPNTRIYKNDAIISAERTFEDAMREAYRTTLIYEYYTGQSYARKGDLYLIRMISYGDKNLEAYLSQLEQSFRDFEEAEGKPDIRVLVLSLRDDILQIPRTNDDRTPRDLNARVEVFQKALTALDRRNEEGYITIPFGISVKPLDSPVSPSTYNHKVLWVEAEINATSKGDDVGRIYLHQKGTGMIRDKDGQLTFHVLPERKAVINPFFNGAKIYSPDIYQNFSLRDRPLGNTRWELQFNQVSEKANQDIDANSISDVVLYIYYSDFTKEQ